jgi:HSP20 family molecular chaperone IbpA
MLLPSIFENKFMDNFFDDFFSLPSSYRTPSSRMMDTNIKDLGKEYMLEIELPGYDKDQVHAELKNGYLTISAEKQETKEENDENGRYIRRERYSGNCKRSFYVGEHLKEEDFQATFDSGILKLVFPKEDRAAKIEEKKYISIK